MAFTGTVNAVTQSGVSLEIDVTYTDSATGFTIRQNVHIQDGSTATTASVVQAIKDVGSPYKAALAAYNVVKANVGAVVTVP